MPDELYEALNSSFCSGCCSLALLLRSQKRCCELINFSCISISISVLFTTQSTTLIADRQRPTVGPWCWPEDSLTSTCSCGSATAKVLQKSRIKLLKLFIRQCSTLHFCAHIYESQCTCKYKPRLVELFIYTFRYLTTHTHTDCPSKSIKAH